MGQGYLIVRASMANDVLPVQDAVVTVRDDSGQILYTLKTDTSGETEAVALCAPDRALSLDPGFFGVPYSTYQVELQADGFVTEVINGVQILDGEEAVEQVDMHPLIPGENEVHILDIEPHVQVLNEPRYQRGPIEPLAGRAMQRVFIPEIITVHLGHYTASARNIQVPFPLYIKNVASSEIYATWPAAALEANIRAIINFALNRVYTEWYRIRNYNFDITNSTQNDMKFIEGRDIFTSIGNIVDRVMGQYLRRPGHNEPYFTEFCDGRIATCNGMKQWGSYDLANIGFNAMQIIHYYYPSDLFIDTAPFAPIVESYPGVSLSQGKQGPDVQLMQLYLNRIRQNYPLIPNIPNPNGIFGTDTVTAVRTFQEIFNLPVTGVIDRATWNRIAWYYTAVTRLADLTSEGDRIVLSNIPPNTVIGFGNSGGLVARLQYMMNYVSQFYSDIPSVRQDGAFGSATRSAVVAFQNRFGLTADGTVGPATWQRLYEVYGELKGTTPPVQPPPTGYFNYTVVAGDTLWALAQRFGTTVEAITILIGLTSSNLSIGQVLRIPSGATQPTGDPVMRQIQTTLNQRYNAGLTVDGIFGRATKAAIVRGVQTELNRQFGRNLVVDGIWGPATMNATVTVRPGAQGNITFLIQAALYSRGYNVTPDGTYGPATEAAVRAFQRDQGITVDGIAGPVTQDRLFR